MCQKHPAGRLSQERQKGKYFGGFIQIAARKKTKRNYRINVSLL